MQFFIKLYSITKLSTTWKNEKPEKILRIILEKLENCIAMQELKKNFFDNTFILQAIEMNKPREMSNV